MNSLAKLAVTGLLLLWSGIRVLPAEAQSSTASSKPAAAATAAIFPATVARVNGSDIPGRDLEDLIQRELSSIGSPEWKNLREDYRNQLTLDLINVLINSKLLYQKAVESGFKSERRRVQAEFQKSQDIQG